ncbi:MAG: hypothetical protein KZQ83_16835 [gamma proteobacterium symbiont of Taylorina sp.]|nr:hypothetical protein [gamma proteobacterium symbiont of Taylorina sp.]
MAKSETSIVQQHAHESQREYTRNNWALQNGQSSSACTKHSQTTYFNIDDELEWLRASQKNRQE